MIEIHGVSKSYGRLKALKDVSFTCRDGQITGLLGVNGAGKTTLLNIVTSCMPAGAGDVKINGLSLRENGRACRRQIGYLPERPPLYDEMTVEDYLRFVCRLRDVKASGIARHVDNILELCGLTEVRSRLLGHLSKGYRQRAGIAQALCGVPPVIVLDEPTVGLDPRQVVEIRELIRKLGEDHTVLFSSHLLHEVQNICQRVVILHHGRVLREDDLSALEHEGRSLALRISVKGGKAEVERALRELQGFRKVQFLPEMDAGYTEALVQVSGSEAHAEERLFRLLAARDLPLRLMTPGRDSLEEIFLQVTDQEGGGV